MNKIEKNIDQFLGKDPHQTYFVACSGGVDSIVLLHLFIKLKKRVSAVHVNYMLRGEDSEKDQQFVEDYCKKAAIPCHVKRVDLHRYLEVTGGNLQETARKVRYAYFETFKVKKDFRIVLGQHADDQVETFFLNLARGGGIMGLSGMLREHDQYLRPLLPFTKKEIVEYAIENNIPWREDVSNSASKYNRNKLRNILIPEMKKVSPDLHDSVLTLMNAFQETQRGLETEIAPFVQSILKTGELPFEEYDHWNTFQLTELLRQLELPHGFIQELQKLRTSQTGKAIHPEKSKFGQIIVERDHFYFELREDAKPLPKLILETVKTLPESFNKEVVFLDPDKIDGRIELRYWKEGDRIKPIGVQGSKLISDILTDAKVPSHLKRKQLVLSDARKILWCVGYSISREATAQSGTEILKVSLEK